MKTDEYGKEPYDVRPMDAIDRATVARWLERHTAAKHPGTVGTFPIDLLPAKGLAARDGRGKLAACATCYLDRSSPVAVCGWCVGDPDNPPRRTYEAVRTLLAAMPDYARAHGARYLLTIFGNRGINRMLDQMDFLNGETCENKIKIL